MRIYFGTNRNANRADRPTDFGNRFSPNGLTDLRFGWADVRGRNLDRYALTVAEESLDVGLDRARVKDLSGQVLGSRKVFDEVRKEMVATRQDCVIYVHGFNTTFEDAIRSTARLKHFYRHKPMVFFLFTWPSDGSLMPFKAYISDRDDARASGIALGRGLQKLANYLRGVSPEEYCGQKLHLFAHSMGNYALRWALQGIRKTAGDNLRRLLEQIVLFAPDEDDDAFELDHKLKVLPDMGRRVTVYHNAGDKALVVSDTTKSNPDRLGAGGPRNSRALPDKVSVVNCEPVIRFRTDPTGHQYYAVDETVRRDVLAVLDGAEPQAIPTRRYQPETRSYRLRRPGG